MTKLASAEYRLEAERLARALRRLDGGRIVVLPLARLEEAVGTFADLMTLRSELQAEAVSLRASNELVRPILDRAKEAAS